MATLAHLLNTNYQIGSDFSFCSDHSSKRDRRPVQTPFDQSVTQNIDFSWLCACVLVKGVSVTWLLRTMRAVDRDCLVHSVNQDNACAQTNVLLKSFYMNMALLLRNVKTLHFIFCIFFYLSM